MRYQQSSGSQMRAFSLHLQTGWRKDHILKGDLTKPGLPIL